MSAKWSLVVAILGSTMAFVDGTVVNVALPVMQHALGASVAAMQWVVEAYALFLASLVLVGGALGDRLGRRRVFSAGIVIFAVASAGCAAAPSAALLIGARAVQGVGAALLVPGSLALISAAYDEDTRGRAIGIWSASSAMTTALGPVLGGWLVAHASWRWVFLMNLPIAAVTLLLSRRVAETRDSGARGAIDVPGAALTVVGLGAIVLALVEAPSHGGLAAPRALGLLGLGVLALALFVVVERRHPHPIVPLGLFQSRTFSGTNLLTLLLYGALGGAFFFLPFDLIQVEGYSPAAAGASLLPMIVLISTLGPWSGGLVARHGARLPLVAGPLVTAAGFVLLALPSGADGNDGTYWTRFFPGVVVLGLGMGVTVAPLTTTVMGAVSPEHAGLASGINNAVARAAGLLAVAGLGVLLVVRFDGAMESAESRLAPALSPSARASLEAQRDKLAGLDLGAVEPPLRDAVRHALDSSFVAAFHAVLFTCAALAVAGALVAAVLVEAKPGANGS